MLGGWQDDSILVFIVLVTFVFGRLREDQLLLPWRDREFGQHDPAIEKIWEGEAVGKQMIQPCVLMCDVSHHAERQVSVETSEARESSLGGENTINSFSACVSSNANVL